MPERSQIKQTFRLPPEEAIKYFERKGNKLTWDWWEMWEAEHAKSFTVAKATTLDILSDIRDEVDKALQEGITLGQFQKELQPKLEGKGWWGRRIIVDEQGEARKVYYGTPYRLKVIFDANVHSAYSAGRYKQMMQVVDTMPYWQYLAVLDAKTRPDHRRWHGMVVRYDDPWWDHYYPPNGWGCRCRVRALSATQVKRLGLVPTSPEVKYYEWANKATGEIHQVPVGVDPGWGYNVGKVAWSPDLGKYTANISSLWNAPQPLSVQTYADIEPVVRERLGGYFKRGFKRIEFTDGPYFMQTDAAGIIRVSNKKWGEFNPQQSLFAAMKKLGREGLSFDEEYALEALWHEIIHNQQVMSWIPKEEADPRLVFLETITQFVARHTYPDMLKALANTGAIHQAEILRSGYGYAKSVSGLRNYIDFSGLDEKDILGDILTTVKNHSRIDYLTPISRLFAEKSGREASTVFEELWNLMGQSHE